MNACPDCGTVGIPSSDFTEETGGYLRCTMPTCPAIAYYVRKVAPMNPSVSCPACQSTDFIVQEEVESIATYRASVNVDGAIVVDIESQTEDSGSAFFTGRYSLSCADCCYPYPIPDGATVLESE